MPERWLMSGLGAEDVAEVQTQVGDLHDVFSDPAQHGVQHDHRSDHTIEARRETQARAFESEHPR